jgi:hypothetical protein
MNPHSDDDLRILAEFGRGAGVHGVQSWRSRRTPNLNVKYTNSQGTAQFGASAGKIIADHEAAKFRSVATLQTK